jgi:hypothetical protein
MHSAIQRCPDKRLDPAHYRDDGTCLHVPPAESVNGYANAETFRFEAATANDAELYADLLNVAVTMLQRVPSMTDQTLGRNIVDHVRGWLHDVDQDERPVNRGWADHHTVTSSPAKLRALRDEVGDLRMVNETDVGESWRESAEGVLNG